ncbi:hypothetical protein QFC21_006500 [Naganishia friedmannii]|uniref:Uncharacterized protein n=1 Tax=Naganishia friedmannii TaxID=89922 RepID=A0ACC2V269_9TREE|nr:hypothetical protein QFC21_006500 [Naganishia friedmannii]
MTKKKPAKQQPAIPFITADDIRSALAVQHSDGLPPWTTPFIEATVFYEQLEVEDAREEERRRQEEFMRGVVTMEMAYDEMKGIVRPPPKVSEEDIRAAYDAVASAKRNSAELLMRHAIELCNGTQVVLFNWLMSVRLKAEKWTEARQYAEKVVALVPFHSATLFQLSTCYEHEREFVKAHTTYKNAMAFLPSHEWPAHKAKLARLKEQSDDMQANIFRGDPLDILPLEVVLEIMFMGMEQDPYFVLKSTWVNKKWRNTLIGTCPELWGTMRLPWKQVRDYSFEDKRRTWSDRAKWKFDRFQIVDMTCAGADKISRALVAKMEPLKRLEVSAISNKALYRLSTRLMYHCNELQQLVVDGGKWQTQEEDSTFSVLHCRFPGTTLSLRTMEIRNVDFRNHDYYRDSDSDAGYEDIFGYALMRTMRARRRGRLGEQYPLLRRLEIEGCLFDTRTSPRYSDSDEEIGWNPDEESEERPPPGPAYKSDPLHAVLRYAENLQDLRIKPDWTHHMFMRQDEPKTKTTLPRLKNAVIPPPSLWGINIVAPNLESLAFAIDDDKARSEAEDDARDLTSLVPTIAESPATIESLVHLAEISFECNLADSISKLEEWLPHLPNVRKLSIRGAPGVTLHRADADLPAKPTHEEILQSLVDHPDWLPKLEHVDLMYCRHPDETVVAFVQGRKVLEGEVGGLKSVVLKGCTTLSDEVCERLKKELKVFSAPSVSSPKGC